jgi:uncharacterized peroxidase-related enzyme
MTRKRLLTSLCLVSALALSSAPRTESLTATVTNPQTAGIGSNKGKETAMTQFRIHTADTAPEGSKELLKGLQGEVGFIPNLAATMAESPEALESFLKQRAIFSKTSFTPIEREVISMSVALINKCTYCMAAHSTFARKSGAEDKLLDTIRNGKLPEDRRLNALARVSRAVLENKGVIPRDLQAEFLQAGYTQRQLLEVLVGVSMAALANYVHHLTDAELDQVFQPLKWSASA